ncbi:PREDICTED: uncharacterized protein LOC109464070, partial [Branchiostoma belcheri]|uniref:Uncharacterized protein LOC109464070 n=1 Tax=Branchiostoma belcheri TaxID=7741 RepID=A0A6P4YCW1_BRABE
SWVFSMTYGGDVTGHVWRVGPNKLLFCVGKSRRVDMVQKYEPATTAKSAMEMTILWGLVVTLVCPPLATCGTTPRPETATSTMRAFDGASLATFRPSTRFAQMRIGNTSETNTVISLRFKTRNPDGLLVYFGGPTYLALSLHRGGLVLSLKTQENRTASKSTFGEDFNDGNWHQITIHRNSHIAYLEYNTENLLGHGIVSEREDLHTDQLFIGGAPDAALPPDFQWRTSFRGCIEDVRFASYMSSDPKDPEKLYFHRDSFSGIGYLNDCAESLTCSWFDCLDFRAVCNLGVCECGSSYVALSEDPLVCGYPTTYRTFTDTSNTNGNRNNFGFSFDGELSIVWLIIISVSIFVALLCLCICVSKRSSEPTPKDSMHRTSSNGAFPEDGGFPVWVLVPVAFFAVLCLFCYLFRTRGITQNAQTTTALPMTQTQSSETAFDLNPPTYQEVVAVTDVNPTLTETSTEPPSANQQTELSNHDRGVQQQGRPSALPSSTSGPPSNYESNQVPPEGQRSPGVPPPSYESFMQYSKTPPGSLEALDV